MKLVLVGGFLGSGKTTALTNASLQLMEQQRSIAVITNDQGQQQVDTAHLQGSSIPVQQVANGCFCCNFNELHAHLGKLISTQAPEIIFAEAVGSCTDLAATIVRPMAAFNPDIDIVISVFADAALLLPLLQNRASFIDDNVRYVYKKQLEDADIIVVNKADTVDPEELNAALILLHLEQPRKIIIQQNSKSTADIARWIKTVETFVPPVSRTSLAIDYDMYAKGEAALAWLDKSINIHAQRGQAAQAALRCAQLIYGRLIDDQLFIGHLKFYIESNGWSQKQSYTMTGSDSLVAADIPFSSVCTLLINAHVQTEPARLKNIAEEAIRKIETEQQVTVVHGSTAYFSPAYPAPVHRIP
jgi:Ni2+-binding GTPase involved in maturation of urease and hydrogenase